MEAKRPRECCQKRVFGGQRIFIKFTQEIEHTDARNLR